jgi:riboflavin kinase/FMN adenylyltransferase
MTIFSWEEIEEINSNPSSPLASFFKGSTALTIGGFDGPHRGHESLLRSVLDKKNEFPVIKTGIITFNAPPKSKQAADFPGEVSTLHLRLEWFKHMGFDFAVVIDFSHKFSTMSGTDFLSIVYSACFIKFLFVGRDFKCGYKGATGIAELHEFAASRDLTISVLNTVSIGGMKVSSSAIRTAVTEGHMKYAEQLLGRPYTLDGTVIEWNHNQKDDYHTFEIGVNAVTQVLPPEGKYDVSVLLSDMTVSTAVCHCDAEFLRLSVSHPAASISVRAIDFI